LFFYSSIRALHCYASYRDNEEACRLIGVDAEKVKKWFFIFAALWSGLSGAIVACPSIVLPTLKPYFSFNGRLIDLHGIGWWIRTILKVPY